MQGSLVGESGMLVPLVRTIACWSYGVQTPASADRLHIRSFLSFSSMIASFGSGCVAQCKSVKADAHA